MSVVTFSARGFCNTCSSRVVSLTQYVVAHSHLSVGFWLAQWQERRRHVELRIARYSAQSTAAEVETSTAIVAIFATRQTDKSITIIVTIGSAWPTSKGLLSLTILSHLRGAKPPGVRKPETTRPVMAMLCIRLWNFQCSKITFSISVPRSLALQTTGNICFGSGSQRRICEIMATNAFCLRYSAP